MTHPTLEQYIEGVDKEFDKLKIGCCHGGNWDSNELHDNQIKSFLKSSIQGAWEKAEKKGFEEAVKEVLVLEVMNDEDTNPPYDDEYRRNCYKNQLRDQLRQKLSELRRGEK